MNAGAGDDTIEVRSDEQFDESAVHEYLRAQALPGSEKPMRVRQFGGGAANLTYELDFGDHTYVLRRPPLGPVAKSAHDMGREYRVLSVLHKALPQAPRAWAYCDDETLIGAPFFIMERLQGTVVRRHMPAHFADIKDAPRRMSEALVDTLADFHAVDYRQLGLADLGKPEGFVERQIEGWYQRWHKAKDRDLEEMDTLHAWLLEHLPPGDGPTLVHNDYKLDNVMFSSHDPGRLLAIFDWDMCTLGDPLCDVGSLLAYWIEPDDSPEARLLTPMPADTTGWLTRRELVERYAQRSGRDVVHIDFYHVLGLYRLVVILQQIYIRWVRGQTRDSRFEALGEIIPACARQAVTASEQRLLS